MPVPAAYLPALNELLDAASAILLAAGYLFIWRQRVPEHKRCILSAFGSSTVFFVSYLILRYFAGLTRFIGQGWIRSVYFTVLISHTILATAIVPLALVTLSRGLTGHYDRHVRIARWTLPLWLYASATGVLVYWMLLPALPASLIASFALW